MGSHHSHNLEDKVCILDLVQLEDDLEVGDYLNFVGQNKKVDDFS